ncbi:phosphonate C-P lyase system protein PhnH [Mesorhizobium retamae]|uniref:Phosphonate C-P lyase system protein PhnH n=1 Tax=Mesorhizobium retamae TaxID=2912854 RepID=A0ABS9QF38_9HYPH|nr:phosphonate C-P lyase system protein PhnH [Mesorhizobium sp. IRAMC:0171]MCG7505416.1 phosphonate C-P lyase system protein PhnH [Mesorhizobium sp. IRAMC:0171]
MLTIPRPDAEDARDNAVFDAVLWAMSRPGDCRHMTTPGPLAVALALVDQECRAHAEDPDLAEALRRTGATLVDLERADHVFLALDSDAALFRLERLSLGDPLYPEQGATLVSPARIGQGAELKLTGPGIETETRLCIGNVHPQFWAQRKRLCAYPLGFEVIFVDGEEIVAIPRSTLVEEI